MDKIYANLILANKKVWGEIPAQIKERVKQVLQLYIEEGKLKNEEFLEIVNEEE